ncbi:LexA repressor [Koleobacter methoxysyntrophicus]|jgi:repressor LexA|uniref:LexA repressor n=1 Tax=Koleobacter methoxysyntrophicus TaxID=2751313 RepID=A0A8A0RSH8_9FIRM|nr:transcriptional repressor LexA [Koleobacter methoxysyntrophicus]MDK2901109.1 repressor LexA [Thermosediminibacterales bacterium]NPV44912.1 transcriptional repressor LexA [Bacillota bacterium]QSQ10136.1 LexA repressor [Koleobacter methoxysyntrophicus]
MYEDLSERQNAILNFIKQELKLKGYPPSVREICKAVGLNSTSTVHSHLSTLEKKGYIRRDPTKPRAIELLDSNYFSLKEMVEVPIVGRVTAGEPILAVENIEDTFPLPLNFVRDDNVFMLSVKGTSMINAGILDNDWVLVKQQDFAKNGDIIVALIGDEATVKRFYKEQDHIRLQPENPDMDPIILKEVKIIGKVIGVFRKID